MLNSKKGKNEKLKLKISGMSFGFRLVVLVHDLVSQKQTSKSIVSSLAAKRTIYLYVRGKLRIGDGSMDCCKFPVASCDFPTIEMHINMRFLQCLHIGLLPN